MHAPFLLAQLSDLHIKAGGRLSYGVVDTLGALRLAVDRLNALQPRPDALVITGDLVDFGTPEEYATLREVLAELAMPFFVIPGNHDDRAALRAAFADHPYLPAQGTLDWQQDCGPLRLIGLDTHIPGEHGGRLDARQLAWLDDQLAQAPEQPTLVLLHHPPFPVGIGHMDRIGLAGGAELEAVIRRHPQVERLLCGHLHRLIQRRFGGTLTCVCPGVSHQVDLDLREAAPSRFRLEPPGLLLHRWADEALVTHHLPLGNYPGPYPFFAADGQLLD